MTTTNRISRQRIDSNALLNLIQHITGLPWEWCQGNKKLLGVEGEWQLMPLHPQDEADFWWWHLKHSRQWFDSKYEATTALLLAWFAYIQVTKKRTPQPLLILFHAGCQECTQQALHGTEFCFGCRWFDAEWDKPDLSNRPPTTADIERERIKQKMNNKRGRGR